MSERSVGRGAALSWRRSLRWRLPGLVVGLIVVVLGAFMWVAYSQMDQTLTAAGRTRAQSAADELVGLLAPAQQQRIQDMKRLAADPVLHRFLLDPTDANRSAAEDRLKSVTGSSRQVVEVWNRRGDRLAVVSMPANAAASFPEPLAPTGVPLRLAKAPSGAVFSDMTAPVDNFGFLVLRRPVATSSPDVLNKLVGNGARIHLGSGGAWTDLTSIITPSPQELLGPGVAEYRGADGTARVAAVAEIKGTPWLVSVEFPHAFFMAPARTFLYRTGLAALGLILLAGVLSAVATARITTPLAALTHASEAIAAGDVSRRVATERSDEIGRLGMAFNSMVSQVQEAHEHLMLAVQGSKVGIWEWTVDGDRVTFSAQWKQMLGYADHELDGSGAAIREIFHPDDRNMVSAGIRACLKGEVDSYESEYRMRRKDGGYVWVLSRGVVSRAETGRVTRLAGTSVDITAQKLAREDAIVQARHAECVAAVAVALTESGEWRDMLGRCGTALVEHLDVAVVRIWTAAQDETVLELQASAGLNVKSEEALARLPFGTLAAGRAALGRDVFVDNDVTASRYGLEAPADLPDVTSYAAFPLLLGDRLVGVMAMFARTPLTESALAVLKSVARTIALGIERKRLNESRERFEDLLESATDFVTIGRLTGPPLYVNRAARQALGIGKDEQVASLYEFRPKEFQAFFEGTVLPAAMRDGLWKGQVEYVSRTGQTIPVSQVSIVHTNAAGEVQYLSTISRDISEELRAEKTRNHLEEQLRRAQKIEAIGQLAGGLAHDFNNLLTVILGFANVLGDQFEKNDPRCEDIDQIRRAGDRASQLTRQLLAFSRKQILNPVIVDPNTLIEGIRPMLSRLVGEAIDLVVSYDPNVSAIKFDTTQMELILVNLTVNARDAMPHGGRLTIETVDVDLDEEFCRTHLSVEPGRYVRLSVTDTGVGIDDETKKRIFEPFFTTKGRDKGTGLGLATVFGIVKQSGGSVWVYSEPGLGASFKVFVPVAKDGKPVAALPTHQPLSKGSETILVVEDEAGVRQLVQTVLKRAGYTVLTAGHPIKAIEMAANPAQPIDLLITDVIMPDMNGATLSRELSRRRPTLRALFMSGFADDAIEHHGVLAVGTAFLQKPFTASDLTRKVREVLDEVESGVIR